MEAEGLIEKCHNATGYTSLVVVKMLGITALCPLFYPESGAAPHRHTVDPPMTPGALGGSVLCHYVSSFFDFG